MKLISWILSIILTPNLQIYSVPIATRDRRNPKYYLPLPYFDENSFINVKSLKGNWRQRISQDIISPSIANSAESGSLSLFANPEITERKPTEPEAKRIVKLDTSIYRGRGPEEYSVVNDLLNLLEKEIAKKTKIKPIYKKWDGLFEKDIVLTHKTALHLLQYYKRGKLTKQLTSKTPTWRGINPIPYIISDVDGPETGEAIDKATVLWEKETCIRFEKVNESTVDHLNFFTGAGCWSYIGKTGGEQMVSVSKKCPKVGEIAHEIGHALGLWHEQSRHDRDFYVSIIYENVEQGGGRNFAKIARTDSKAYYMPYDLSSIMHYDSLALSGNNLPTLKTKLPRYQAAMGNREYITFADAKIINHEYCSETCGYEYRASKCMRNGYPDPNNCTRCKCPDGFGGLYCESVLMVDKECGPGILRQREGFLRVNAEAPGNETFNTTSCSWLIQALPCQLIHLEVIQVSIGGIAEDGIRCLNWIEFRTNADLSLTGARLCGYDLPANKLFTSIGSEMLILYRINLAQNDTDNSNPNTTELPTRSFSAKYRIEDIPYCQNYFRGFSPMDHAFNSVSISNLHNIDSL